MPDKKLLIAFLIPVIILLSMTVVPVLTFYRGHEILLETQPYDPRDLFRGDYVSLGYKINTIDGSLLEPALKDQLLLRKVGSAKLYAVLKEANGYYEVARITSTKPSDSIYLICNITYIDSLDRLHVEYNLDKYFVPENTGRELENMSRRGQLVARVKVYQGYPLLMEIYPKT